MDNAQYNLNTLNCTDVGIMSVNPSDTKLPDTQGSWPGGSGSNPANTGEDIREISGAITTPGVATTVNITDAQISGGPVVTASPGTPVVGNPAQAPAQAPANNNGGSKVDSKKSISGN